MMRIYYLLSTVFLGPQNMPMNMRIDFLRTERQQREEKVVVAAAAPAAAAAVMHELPLGDMSPCIQKKENGVTFNTATTVLNIMPCRGV